MDHVLVSRYAKQSTLLCKGVYNIKFHTGVALDQ